MNYYPDRRLLATSFEASNFISSFACIPPVSYARKSPVRRIAQFRFPKHHHSQAGRTAQTEIRS